MNTSSGTQPSNGGVQGSRQQGLRLETVAGLTRRLSLATEPGEINRTSTKMVGEAFEIEKCAILLYDEGRQTLVCQSPAFGLDDPAVNLLRFSVKEGTILRSLWDRGEPWIIDDLATDPRFEKYRDWSVSLGLRSLAMGALRVGQARIGALLWANKKSGERFTQSDLFWFRFVSDQISAALNYVQTLNARTREAKRSTTLAQIAGLLHATLNYREVTKAVSSIMLGATGSDRCHLFLKRAGEFKPELSVARANGQPWRVVETVDDERARWFHEQWPTLDHENINVIEDVFYSPLVPSTWTSQFGIKSLILIPVWAKEELIGCMMIEDIEQVRHLDPSEIAFIEAVAAQCGLALKNAQTHSALQDQLLPLQTSAETYPPLVEGAGAAILVVQDGRYGFASGAATAVLGYKPEEFVEMSVPDLFSAQTRTRVAESYQRLLQGERVSNFDAVAIGKGGQEVLLAVAGSVVNFEGDKAVEFVAIDTTDQQMQRDRQLQASKLEAVTRLIGNLVGEVRNALTPVVGYTELALDMPDLTSELKHNLELIAHGAERAKKTFDKLAAWAEIRPPVKTHVNINELLEQIMSLRQYELQGYHIETVMDLSPLLTHVTTQADPQQLQIAFLSLIDNARDALMEVPEGRQLTIRTGRQGRGAWALGEVITISFQDNGPGIAAENLARVFDPFFSTKPPTQALGLGLWITYQIIKNHNGEIYVRSRPGEGATFVVELPIVTDLGLPEE